MTDHLRALTGVMMDRLRGRREEIGASVLEWALIAAALVLAVSIITPIVIGIIRDKTGKLDTCSKQVNTSQCQP